MAEFEENKDLSEEFPEESAEELTEKAAEEELQEVAEAEEPQAAEEVLQAGKDSYTPRPLGFRIFALVLAALVILGTIIYYYNIFTAGR